MRVNGSVLRFIVCGAMLAACSDDDADVVVRAHTDPNADFASYKTFAFTTETDAGTLNIPGDVSSNLGVVNSAVKSQLEQEGLTEVAADEDPDVLAFSLTSTRDQTARSWVCAPGYWYGYWDDGYGDPCAVMEPTYTEYTEGTVAVGLIDPTLGRTVFGGVAKGVVEGDENDIQREVDGAVEKIFDDYPKDQTGGGN